MIPKIVKNTEKCIVSDTKPKKIQRVAKLMAFKKLDELDDDEMSESVDDSDSRAILLNFFE